METKKCSGSERVKRNSTSYLANERSCQGAFASHPKGMALPAPDRRRNARTGAYWPALRASPNPASGRNHVTLRNVRRPGPSCSSPAFLRLFEAVAEPANRRDDVRPEFFANSCDED